MSSLSLTTVKRVLADLFAERSIGAWLGASIAGALFVTVCLRLNWPDTMSGGFAATLALVPVCAYLAWYSEYLGGLVAFFAVGGGVAAVIVDAMLDTRRDRNLWPIEVMFCAVLVAPAAFSGAAAGWLIARLRGGRKS